MIIPDVAEQSRAVRPFRGNVSVACNRKAPNTPDSSGIRTTRGSLTNVDNRLVVGEVDALGVHLSFLWRDESLRAGLDYLEHCSRASIYHKLSWLRYYFNGSIGCFYNGNSLPGGLQDFDDLLSLYQDIRHGC